MEQVGGAGESFTDIQTYLASFNKEIQGGGAQAGQGQEYVIQQADGMNFIANADGQLTVLQAEDGTTQLVMAPQQTTAVKQEGAKTELTVMNGQPQQHIEQQLMTPAAPVMDDGSDAIATTMESLASGEAMVSQADPSMLNFKADGDSSGAAVQVLASMAASSIPQPDQLPAMSNGPESLTTSTTDSSGQDVVLSTGSNQYQTVTIVPSETNQGGEVSYVLIVSQPDGEQAKQENADHMDMSIYDFKEEKGAGGDMGPPVEEGEEDVKKVIRVTPRKTAHGMQAQLMCNYCNYTSPKRYLLTRHMKTHSEERPHKCNICDHGFKTVASLQNHINTHTGVRPHKCKECDACFTTSGEMVRHVRYRHTFEKPHKCTECDYCSVELSKLKRHIRSHTGERPYQCPHCSYASPDTFKLKRHLRIHTGEKPYECEICHARFTQSNSLKAHIPIHTGNKPVFQCELCPTTCGRKTDLKIHVQKLHTSERPMQCRKCGKSFPDRYTYKIHLKTHDGEKCYKCELCPYAALSQRHLQSHILTHTGEKPFQCQECDQSFRQKQLLKRHMNLYHTPDYVPPPPREKVHECSECHRSFAHRGNLLRHMALHDPENPDYKNLPDATEEEEMEMEEDQIQYVQIVSEDGTEGSGPIQLQLVTEDGENTILLQMEEGQDGGSDMTPLVNALSGANTSTPISRHPGQAQHRPQQLQQQQVQIQQIQQPQQLVQIQQVPQQQQQQVLTQSTIVHHKQVVRTPENDEDSPRKRSLRTRSAKATDDQKSYIIIKQEEEVGRHGGDEMKDDEEDQTISGALKRGIAGTDAIESPRKRRRTEEGIPPCEQDSEGPGYLQNAVAKSGRFVHTRKGCDIGFHGNRNVPCSNVDRSRGEVAHHGEVETSEEDVCVDVEVVSEDLEGGDQPSDMRPVSSASTSSTPNTMTESGDAHGTGKHSETVKVDEYQEVVAKEVVLEAANTGEHEEKDSSERHTFVGYESAHMNSSALTMPDTKRERLTGVSSTEPVVKATWNQSDITVAGTTPHLTPLVPARMSAQLAEAYHGPHAAASDTGQMNMVYTPPQLPNTQEMKTMDWFCAQLAQSQMSADMLTRSLIQDQRDSAAVISGLSHLYMDNHLLSVVPHSKHKSSRPAPYSYPPQAGTVYKHHPRPKTHVSQSCVSSTFRSIQPKPQVATSPHWQGLPVVSVPQGIGLLSRVANVERTSSHCPENLESLMATQSGHRLTVTAQVHQSAAPSNPQHSVAMETYDNLPSQPPHDKSKDIQECFGFEVDD